MSEQSSTACADQVVGYLRKLVQFDDSQIASRWKKLINRGTSLQALISERLTSKKYRGSSLDNNVEERVKFVVENVVTHQSPLRLIVPIGGYKSPSSQEQHRCGWSEMFAIANICELVAPICAFHEPGVEVEFSSDQAVVPTLTKATPELLERYAAQFEQLISHFQIKQRPNLRLRQSQLNEYYDTAQLIQDMTRIGRELEASWYTKLSHMQRLRQQQSATNNFFSKTPGGAAQPFEEIQRSICQHEAYLRIDKESRKHILFADNTIPVALRKGLKGWLHLGSNRRSAVQFWVGSGLLHLTRNGPKAHILPPRQARNVWNDVDYMRTDAVCLQGFESIPVISQSKREKLA